MKHTPGPWIAVGTWVEHPSERVADICVCDPKYFNQEHLGGSEKRIAANARLIAAAPELLKALRAYVMDDFVMKGSTRKAEAHNNRLNAALDAIAKAEGR